MLQSRAAKKLAPEDVTEGVSNINITDKWIYYLPFLV